MVSALVKSGNRITSAFSAKIPSGLLPGCTRPCTALALTTAFEMPTSSTYVVSATMRLAATKSSRISSVLMDSDTMRWGLCIKATAVPVASVSVYRGWPAGLANLGLAQPKHNIQKQRSIASSKKPLGLLLKNTDYTSLNLPSYAIGKRLPSGALSPSGSLAKRNY